MRLETFLIFPYTFLLFVTLYKYALSVNISLRRFGGEKENIEVIKQKKKSFLGDFFCNIQSFKMKITKRARNEQKRNLNNQHHES
jgi:hypothetical protein